MWVLSQATQCLNKTWINIKIIVECANIETEEQDTNQEEQVSKTCDNKCFLAGMNCSVLWIIESNQQI